MFIKVTYAQFLMTHGVAKAKANSIAVGIAAKIMKRQPLTGEEAALTQAFLSRPTANRVAEQYVAAAVNSSTQGRITGFQIDTPDTLDPEASQTTPPGQQVAPSQVKVIIMGSKKPMRLSQRPGSPAAAGVKERHQGAAILTSNFRGSMGIRTLADRVASDS